MTKLNRMSCASFVLICASLFSSDLQIAAEEFIYRDSLELKEYPPRRKIVGTVSGARITRSCVIRNQVYCLVEAGNFALSTTFGVFSNQRIDHLVSINLDNHELEVMTFDSDSRSQRDFELLLAFEKDQFLFSTVEEGKSREGKPRLYRKLPATGKITPIAFQYDSDSPYFVHFEGMTASVISDRTSSPAGATGKIRISGLKEKEPFFIDTPYIVTTGVGIFALDDVNRLGLRSQMSPGTKEAQLLISHSNTDQTGPCGIDAHSLTDNKLKWSIPARAFEEKIGKKDLVGIVPADHIRYPAERFPVTLMFKDNTSYLGIVSHGKIEWVRKVPDFQNWRFAYVSPNSRYVIVTDGDELSLIDCEKQLIMPTLTLSSKDEPVAVASDGTVVRRTRNGFMLTRYKNQEWSTENVQILSPFDQMDDEE